MNKDLKRLLNNERLMKARVFEIQAQNEQFQKQLEANRAIDISSDKSNSSKDSRNSGMSGIRDKTSDLWHRSKLMEDQKEDSQLKSIGTQNPDFE